MLDLELIFPYVRRVQLKRDNSLSGQWQDFDHVLTFLASGSAEFVIEGVQYQIKEGDAVLMPPYSHHIITSEGRDAPLVQYNIHFDFFSDPYRMTLPYRDVWNERVGKAIPDAEQMLGGKVLLASLNNSTQRMMRRFFLLMFDEYTKNAEYSLEMERGLLLCVLSVFLRSLKKTPPASAEPKMIGTRSWTHISAAIDYIGEHYSDPSLSNTDIGAAVGVSPVYLTTEFKKCFGVSLHRYLVNLRLDRASNMLLSGMYSVADISRMTGFSSIQAFSKAFRASQGVGPREYANTHVSKSYDVFYSKRDKIKQR